ncbi:MAG: hypothetical protein BGO49_27595 [Planctomycetales bacterium 71-10]|nr:MAG: hypothetical protein BGO49_27595 [Planctomycetales bacterium 71-10]
MNDNYFTLSQVAKLFARKPYHVTYAITSGHIAEPAIRIGNKRVFGDVDMDRLARYFGVPTPQVGSGGYASEGGRQPGQVPEPLSLAGPFTVEPADTSGHEVRDANGEVFCWAADRPRALVLAGLLEYASG